MSASVVKDRLALARARFIKDLESAVLKATKRNSKPPKRKHVNALISATYRREISVNEITRLIRARLGDFSWNVVFKALILIHHLLNAGHSDRFMGSLSVNPSVLNLAGFYDRSGQGVEQAKNVRAYARYLEERVCIFKAGSVDFVRGLVATRAQKSYKKSLSEGRKELSEAIKKALDTQELIVDLGSISDQVDVLLDAEFPVDEIDNGITYEAYSLLIQDLLHLYHPMNDIIMNILQSFFSMERSEALKAMAIYKRFVKQTERIKRYLDLVKRLPPSLAITLDVPNIRAPPERLAKTLEDYLNDSLTEKLTQATIPQSESAKTRHVSDRETTKASKEGGEPQEAKKELIDFFASIDDNMPNSPAIQGVASNNPFASQPTTPVLVARNPFALAPSGTASTFSDASSVFSQGANSSQSGSASYGNLSGFSLASGQSAPGSSSVGATISSLQRPVIANNAPWLRDSPKLLPAPSSDNPAPASNPFASITLPRSYVQPVPHAGATPSTATPGSRQTTEAAEIQHGHRLQHLPERAAHPKAWSQESSADPSEPFSALNPFATMRRPRTVSAGATARSSPLSNQLFVQNGSTNALVLANTSTGAPPMPNELPVAGLTARHNPFATPSYTVTPPGMVGSSASANMAVAPGMAPHYRNHSTGLVAFPSNALAGMAAFPSGSAGGRPQHPNPFSALEPRGMLPSSPRYSSPFAIVGEESTNGTNHSGQEPAKGFFPPHPPTQRQATQQAVFSDLQGLF